MEEALLASASGSGSRDSARGSAACAAMMAASKPSSKDDRIWATGRTWESDQRHAWQTMDTALKAEEPKLGQDHSDLEPMLYRHLSSFYPAVPRLPNE